MSKTQITTILSQSKVNLNEVVNTSERRWAKKVNKYFRLLIENSHHLNETAAIREISEESIIALVKIFNASHNKKKEVKSLCRKKYGG